MILMPIGRSGELPSSITLCDVLGSVVEATAAMYTKTGFTPPWIGYVAVDEDDGVVGTCAFKSPPVDGRVEIAYFTFPGNEGKGIATRMAQELIHMARQADGNVIITATTLPEDGASTSVLRKLNFQLVGTVIHPEDGTVWSWERA